MGVGEAVGVAEGFGATIFTPLFQTSFLPLLIQVYLMPLTVEVVPALVHVAPALTAARATGAGAIAIKDATRMSGVSFFITSSCNQSGTLGW